MISRRHFLGKTAQGLAASLLLPAYACSHKPTYTGTLSGPNAALGHRLRSRDFPPPGETIKTTTLIIGGGVSGLSAARYLKKHTNDFVLLELEQNTGGNTMASHNATTAYPLGAHYLPLPNDNDAELLAFMTEAGAITGTAHGLPVYNEYYLCHDPKERLYINHLWQEGIVPHESVPARDRDQIQRFLALMHNYKQARGNDQRDAFTIPIAHCSHDPAFTQLDNISAATFLNQHGLTSPYLLWYVNYCCADDFGSGVAHTSAWAMIHYFASRKGRAANAPSDAVLTWPEGNHWLAKQLRTSVAANVRTSQLAYQVDLTTSGVSVRVYDAMHDSTQVIDAQKVIVATPQFIARRLLGNVPREIDYTLFQYAPWMVANLTVANHFSAGRGEPLCWDNVIYGSNALGYVNATHQHVGMPGANTVLTYYRPLLGDVQAARQVAYTRSYDDWRRDVLKDLTIPHPNLDNDILQMDIWLWGHGMIQPSPGFVWNANTQRAAQPIANRIFFAHSDLSGISIFEEAFYRGYTCAQTVLAS